RPAPTRVGHEARAVGARPGERDEEIPRANVARVGGQALDRDARVAPEIERSAVDSREQLTEHHHRATARAAREKSFTSGRPWGPGSGPILSRAPLLRQGRAFDSARILRPSPAPSSRGRARARPPGAC